MDPIDELLKEHARLRTALKELEGVLGPAAGAGWDDCANIDGARLKKRVASFMAAFKAHEEAEDAWLHKELKRLPNGGRACAPAIENQHGVIRDVSRLLSTVAEGCDGQHVYKIRTVMSRVAQTVEDHLLYQENEVFPRLRATARVR